MAFVYKNMRSLLESMSDLRKASDPLTHPDDLHDLSKHADRDVRKAVALNPNISKDTWTAAMDVNPHIALENPVVSLWELENPKFYNDLFLGNKSINHLMDRDPKKFANIFHQSVFWDTRALVAAHPKTPISILDSLITDPHVTVLEPLSKNRNMTDDLLAKLAKNSVSTGDLSHKIALHPNTGPLTLDVLSNHAGDNDLLKFIAMHPNTATPTLKKLAMHYSDYVSKPAKGELYMRES